MGGDMMGSLFSQADRNHWTTSTAGPSEPLSLASLQTAYNALKAGAAVPASIVVSPSLYSMIQNFVAAHQSTPVEEFLAAAKEIAAREDESES